MSKKHAHVSFLLDLFFKNKAFPPFWKKITNSFTNNVVHKTDSNLDVEHKTYSISDVPNYFSIDFKNTTKHLKQLSTPLYAGYLINLELFEDLEDYLNNKLGRPRKSQLKRYRKRLDLCIAPEYKIFHGDIAKKEYDSLFDNLFEMTEQRFAQKEELNFELPFLELYHQMMYPLILKKEACIFAIYHKNKPISITLNFIDEDTVFHWNSCYDINYQMFNLGHINMVNHLEWAFQNGYKIFDMGRGDFLHKRKYINEEYMYNEHVIYNSKSLTASIVAHIKILKLKLRFKLIQFLKKTKLHLWYGKYAKYKYRLAKTKNKTPINIKFNIENTISEIPKLTSLNTINLSKDDYYFLIKPLNYFLHKSQELADNVVVYNDSNNKKTFYFKGLKKTQKITIEN
ncbi:GNAT family N-acetyltransferase [Flavivirga eckloniae]|uniref:BioF2-like acetyltransferase domain-containing protein n=1 Tax=Flavivirga eckloniae TaxID=1803846 RepID=A0A2K9PJP4_9FLAO|nr:GNAT family N-acetyltransferase [Flavivirga eckloniae]AUP77252.1 hypothetical protein C1H87_00375 [Flavivirga eckloniae]